MLTVKRARDLSRDFGFSDLITEPTGNPKFSKSIDSDFYNCGITLAPAKLSGYNVCTMSTAKCRGGCLGNFGRSEYIPSILRARINRTKLLFSDRDLFWSILEAHCHRIDRKARKLGKTVAFRSDILSDLNWHKMFPQLFRDFSHWKFYGYTKIRSKIESMINGSNPVHQTYSFNERTKWRDVENYVSNGVNVAIPFFDSKTLKPGIPDSYKGIKVINGDLTDLRFTDPVGVIVGLNVKLPKSRSKQIATIKRSQGFFVGY